MGFCESPPMPDKPKTIAGLLRSRAESSQAGQLAIRFLEGDRWVEWTWQEYWQTARRVEAGLVAAGVRPGDVVLMLIPEVRPAVACVFGVWALGAVPVQVGLPANLNDPQAFLEQLREGARRLNSRYLITTKFLASFASGGDDVRVLLAEDLQACEATGALPDPD